MKLIEIFKNVKVHAVQFLSEDYKEVRANRRFEDATITFLTDDSFADDLICGQRRYVGVVIWMDSDDLDELLGEKDFLEY